MAVTGGDRAAAEDLAQDTLMVVVANRDDIQTTFRAYCYGVARMKRLGANRKRQARARETSLDEILFTAAGTEAEACSKEDRMRAKLAITVLRRLSPDEQCILIYKDHLGFTQPELAEAFKIPQSRVAGRVHRARRRFRRCFEALELDPSERELTERSLNTALASIVARFPERLLTALSDRTG